MPSHCKMASISGEDETVLAAANVLNDVYSEFDQNKQLKYKTIIQKLTQIIANKPPQRVAAGPPQRVTAPSISVDINAPKTIRTNDRIHQCQTRSNTPMPSIIEEVVDTRRIRFNQPPQGRVEKNSNEWRRECIERLGERKAEKTKNHSLSLRLNNPQAIPDERKQTSARHASRKTIQRLIDEIQMEKDNLPSRTTKAGSIPIRCQLDEELRRRQLANKKATQFLTHNAPSTSPKAPTPATPQRSPQNTLP